MRIFITGGTGFIGKYVVKELERVNHTLLLLSRQTISPSPPTLKAKINILQGDLSQLDGLKDEIKKFAPEIAIHLAWEGLPDYSAGVSARNLKYGLDLINILAESGCKSFIGAGSCWEYGQQTGKVSEDFDLKQLNDFTAAKNSLRLQGKEIAEERGMHFIWTRFFYVYGHGQRETSLIPHIIKSLRQGVMPEIKTPQTKNDFVYVADAARAVCAIVRKSEKDGVYNIGSGVATSVRQIVEIACREFNFKVKYDTLSSIAGSPVIDCWADISRIRQATGWKPQTSIREGIKKTIKYYAEDSVR